MLFNIKSGKIIPQETTSVLGVGSARVPRVEVSCGMKKIVMCYKNENEKFDGC